MFAGQNFMKSSRTMIAAVMLLVLAWGVWQAVGAVRFNGNPWRGVVVLASFAVFLGGWLLLLAQRHRAIEASKRR
jgi:cytochrome c biogenesis factor